MRAKRYEIGAIGCLNRYFTYLRGISTQWSVPRRKLGG